MNHASEPGYLRYYTMLEQYQQTQILFTALRLNLFTHMSDWISAQQIAAKTGYNESTLIHFLLSLSALGFLERDGDSYRNTSDSQDFFSKDSPHFIGETLLFREKMTSLEHLDQFITGEIKRTSSYDFAKLAQVTAPEMYATGRVNSFLEEVKQLFPDQTTPAKVLDLGGGSGILAMEFAELFPNSTAVVFEHPAVAVASREILQEHNAPENVSVIEGDFKQDSFGGPYDLLIASGVLDFAADNLSQFLQKIADALSPNGFLLIIGQLSNNQEQPPQRLVGWLTGRLNGLPLAPSGSDVESTLKKAGVIRLREVSAGRFRGLLYQKGKSCNE